MSGKKEAYLSTGRWRNGVDDKMIDLAPLLFEVYAPKHGVDEKKSSLALLDYF